MEAYMYAMKDMHKIIIKLKKETEMIKNKNWIMLREYLLVKNI